MDANAWLLLLQGAWVTLWISVLSIVLGIALGLVVALVRAARVPFVAQALAGYVSLTRATPLVTLVLMIFIAAPHLGLDLSPAVVGIVALTLNTTAFNAEIWRSALESFPREQLEAAKSVGMTPGVALRRIALPQMFLRGLPALVNEATFLVKASPAVAVIGLVELTRTTQRISAATFEPMPPLLAAAVLYMLLIYGLVRLQRAAEQRTLRLAM
ncbi:amino acid ABC transporter permease [Phytopseudomonas daroniae]|uniref:amino acid ABC transporter permease n=1 Tax=Phytopseudomonas daroniae TaxID=2487519 RepID=UPI0010385576|nr:amino acid ABC transporter permease [Pseudomonas daroniae]TBU75547.1 ABC transporter permease [Pseudomonas daroniae]